MAGPGEIVEKLKLIFKDDKLTFTPGEPGFTQYTFKLDPNTKPASFDMTHADGSKKGETKRGSICLRVTASRFASGMKTTGRKS